MGEVGVPGASKRSTGGEVGQRTGSPVQPGGLRIRTPRHTIELPSCCSPSPETRGQQSRYLRLGRPRNKIGLLQLSHPALNPEMRALVCCYLNNLASAKRASKAHETSNLKASYWRYTLSGSTAVSGAEARAGRDRVKVFRPSFK